MAGRERHGNASDERAGTEQPRSFLTRGLGRLVPVALARRAIAVSVSTDREVYERDEPVSITVEFDNRLPVAVAVPTPTRRRWGWSIDGYLEATDERRYTRPTPSSFDFRAGERKRFTVVWNGRLEKTGSADEPGGVHESIVPDPGEYEIAAFVATRADRHRPGDSTTITIR